MPNSGTTATTTSPSEVAATPDHEAALGAVTSCVHSAPLSVLRYTLPPLATTKATSPLEDMAVLYHPAVFGA